MASTDKPPPIVLVEWEDAQSVGPDGALWVSNRDHEYKPCIFYSVGFLLLDDARGIQLTQAWSPDVVGVPDQIPRGMILRTARLRPGPPRRRS